MEASVPGVETVVYRSDVAAVGTFRCPPHHERFSGGEIEGQLVVFPRTSVVIERDWHPPLVMDPTTAVFYNEGESYTRRRVDRTGDHCDWFAVPPAVAAEIVEPIGRRLYWVPAGPVDASLYGLQRRILEAVASGGGVPLLDELVVHVVADAVTTTHRAHGRGRPVLRSSTRERHRNVVAATKAYILEQNGSVTLAEVAAAVHVSPYHLARLFRAATGSTIHAYAVDLRLRRSLDVALDPDADLATIAIESGFSSHSHYTRSFRQAFGVPPSVLRHLPVWEIAELRKNVTV